jgi:Ca-activated chloride channel homolog
MKYYMGWATEMGDSSLIAGWRPLPNGHFPFVQQWMSGEAQSSLMEHPVAAGATLDTMNAVSAEQRFAVAAFGQRLRGESAVSGFGDGEIANLANTSRGDDRDGYRAAFIQLVRVAETVGQVGLR